eukprot:6190845-Ditylum_brightwellii.AAC.1
MKKINRCTSDIASHHQNNNVIISRFEEKIDKAILDTKQVATKLSEACNKAPALKFPVTYSRFDDIEEKLLNHDDAIQKLVNKISIYYQQKGHFAGSHSTVPNFNDTTKLFLILKLMKH